ncbi:MAG TPA: hypothetical protein VJ547_10625 [Candidatus Thermoplasmatota archaeon]|nr:hypothetical protein [Candidatus Thermoplasmatota archaeon]
MQAEVGLIAALTGDFWRFARLVLEAQVLADLEADCIRAGLRVPGRPFPVPSGDAPPFRRVIDLAGRRAGPAALRRLGFACGSSAARPFEANVLSPNEGALRMVSAFERACGARGWSARADGRSSLALPLAFEPPASPAFLAFVSGFAKGAATRLNEGVVPEIRRGPEGPKALATAFRWSPRDAVGTLRGGRRTPRR